MNFTRWILVLENYSNKLWVKLATDGYKTETEMECESATEWICMKTDLTIRKKIITCLNKQQNAGERYIPNPNATKTWMFLQTSWIICCEVMQSISRQCNTQFNTWNKAHIQWTMLWRRQIALWSTTESPRKWTYPITPWNQVQHCTLIPECYYKWGIWNTVRSSKRD